MELPEELEGLNIFHDLEEYVKDKPIFFVGEGNWTFTLVFAGLIRGNWKDITSSSFHQTNTNHSIKTAIKKLAECQKFDLITRLILTEPPLDSTFIGGVNALCLQEKFPQINAVIWFQCPWPNNAEDPPYELINSFLESAYQVQTDTYPYIFIGVSLLPKYFIKYNINLLKTNKYYELVAYNREFISKMLENGYVHHSDLANIHEKIQNTHCTLVFKRMPGQ